MSIAGCFIFSVIAWTAFTLAVARRHRHARAISAGTIVSTLASLAGAVGIAWLVQRDDATVARVFLAIVVNTGSAFFFGVTAMIVAAKRQPPV